MERGEDASLLLRVVVGFSSHTGSRHDTEKASRGKLRNWRAINPLKSAFPSLFIWRRCLLLQDFYDFSERLWWKKTDGDSKESSIHSPPPFCACCWREAPFFLSLLIDIARKCLLLIFLLISFSGCTQLFTGPWGYPLKAIFIAKDGKGSWREKEGREIKNEKRKKRQSCKKSRRTMSVSYTCKGQRMNPSVLWERRTLHCTQYSVFLIIIISLGVLRISSSLYDCDRWQWQSSSFAHFPLLALSSRGVKLLLFNFPLIMGATLPLLSLHWRLQMVSLHLWCFVRYERKDEDMMGSSSLCSILSFC